MLDPPVAIATAMKRTVRQTRFEEVASQFPGMIPTRGDIGTGTSLNGSNVINFAGLLSNTATGKVQTLKETTEWEKDCAPHLLSAAAGGQWPQVKKARVPKWGITDARCQLCYAATGTMEHRYDCNFVKPSQGWSKMPGWRLVELAITELGF